MIDNILIPLKNKITFVTTPFAGHINVLIQLAQKIAMQSPSIKITFIIVGWNAIVLNQKNKSQLENEGFNLIEIYDSQMEIPDPFYFTFPRACHLTQQVLTACKTAEYIIYDYFAVEAYIVGKYLSIPTICSIAAIIGPFNPKNKLFLKALEANKKYINELENKFNLLFMDKIQMLADAFFIPSDEQNIQWAWPKFIETDNYRHHRELKNYTFMRPNIFKHENSHAELFAYLKEIKTQKKIIYVSFGTIITHHLWEGILPLQTFVISIFNALIEKLGNHTDYEVILSVGKKVNKHLHAIPDNFHIYESVPQQQLLNFTDVFITHGGGNSINESIDAGVPVIVIPFSGDGHQCAANVEKLKIGIAFMHDEKDSETVIQAASFLYARKSLASMDALIAAIFRIIHQPDMKEAIQHLRIIDTILIS